MNDRTRKIYHRDLWPAACDAQGWDPRDQDKRRDVCLECMAEVRGPEVTTSHPNFGDHEVTALFTYLRHRAEPDNISLILEWEKCKADYKAYNICKQADHWESRGSGSRGFRRIQNNRFAGRRTAKGSALEDPLARDQAKQRLWKMRQTTRKREYFLDEAKRFPGRAGSPKPADESLNQELIPF